MSIFDSWEEDLSILVDQSTRTPPPAIVSNAGDALTQAQTGVSQGWGWLNNTVQNTVNAVAQIGVAKYAARNGVALQATAPLPVQDPRTGELVTTSGYYGQVTPSKGPGLMTILLVAAAVLLVVRK